MKMKEQDGWKLACLGAGKMGEALVRGLLASGVFAPGQVSVSDPDPSRREILERECRVRAHTDNREAVREADVVLLAVKPQEMAAVLEGIAGSLPRHALVISIAAGVTTEWIQARLGAGAKVVRVMPNAAALVGKSTTGIYFCPAVVEAERRIAQKIFDTIGISVVVAKEDHLNVVTGLSGSGPAYVFLFLEALADAGVYLGLPRDVSSRLALHTVLGSAHMAAESGKHFVSLKETITSPGGTTMSGLKVMEEGAFRALVMRAVEAASKRSAELAR
ncbi:MAG: pyrroline-5-carboxylate reductase [bacterium]